MNNNAEHPILIVDDESDIISSFALALKTGGCQNILSCQDSRELMEILHRQEIGVVLLDLMMPYNTGQELLKQIKQVFPDLPVIIITGINDVKTAVECMQHGAFDYIVKPISPNHLLPAVGRALEVRRLQRENRLLKKCINMEALAHPEAFAAILTQSPLMIARFQYCEGIAKGRHPVLITGETGTGKELVANVLHDLNTNDKKMVTVNVAGVDAQVFSDTLFGHVKGAFTHATQDRCGLIAQAAGSTLFLDEIGDLAEEAQVKLLRFLEQREYVPLGADVAKTSDARIISATYLDPDNLRAAGRLRSDLYYRLTTHHIHLPPLRERPEDIPLLLAHFLTLASKEFNKPCPDVHPRLLPALKDYTFPGNIRELKAMVFDAVGNSNTPLIDVNDFKSLSPSHQAPVQLKTDLMSMITHIDRLPSLKNINQCLIDEALKRTKNNYRAAARMLGISHSTLIKRKKSM